MIAMLATEAPSVGTEGGFFADTAGIMLVLPFLAFLLILAFGKNLKTPNVGKLASDISKAQSKFTKGFTKAEFSGSGASKGCQTIEDADDIEAKVDAFVVDVLDDLMQQNDVERAVWKW